MNLVLENVKNCNVYLDDVVVYSGNWASHSTSLTKVFQWLIEAFLTLNLARCEFGEATVSYLGKQVGHGQVDAKVSTVLFYPVPTSRRKLRRFLGMAGYYFSMVVHPLTSLCSPRVPFIWSTQCQYAFEATKSVLCSAPVLAATNLTWRHPVCYFSVKFKRHQLNYSTTGKQTLAGPCWLEDTARDVTAAIPDGDTASKEALNNAAVEFTEDLRWHAKLPQPPQKIQPLLGPLYQVCGGEWPNEVITDVDFQVFEAALSLYFKLLDVQWPMRSPFLPFVHYHLLRLVRVEGEVVVPTPWHQTGHLPPVGHFIPTSDASYHCSVICKL